MAELAKNLSGRKCPQCGAELPASLPAELCPKCLLKAGLGTQPVIGPGGTVGLPVTETKSRGLPQPGEKFGHYRIVRLLGEGGMGAAFEADDLESGRRVALKVLSHKLDSPDARERFFREGRLAASINHPNSVYVFGTEEIGGTPAIAMELVPGGTLQNLLDTRGPLPVGEAVDAVLQIIAGLEAAQRIGILHRDIKPSNCFRDTDGTVKIGDFGLSISTAVRTEPALTATGAFLGTPAFSSPEQLRGDELNARSDMYSVGVTLFYLLTRRMPFEGENVVQILANVLEQRAPSPRKFRANIPQGLAKVILRCLEKQPGDRFRNYPELASALAAFSSTAPTPATLGLRFVAGAVDMLVQSVVSLAVMWLVFGGVIELDNLAGQPSFKTFCMMFGAMGLVVCYYALLEGIWGASVGKAVCRLRVVGPDNSLPGLGRGFLRALIYVLIPATPYWLIFGADPKAYLNTSQWVQPLIGLLQFVIVGLFFTTARRRNGFAAWHDLVTKTRVVSRVALQARPMLAVIETPPPAVESKVTVGPYHILETLEKSSDAEWLLGYDLRLLRKVWIRKVSPETPAVPAALRNIGRVGRLRWLTGRRSPEENWDAFEAATGEALLQLTRTSQPWKQVRFWLYDLASEISAGEKNGTLPPVLSLDRVWITADGRAKLLDFSPPGIMSRMPLPSSGLQDFAQAGGTRNAHQFLNEVATAALSGQEKSAAKTFPEAAVRLPLHARTFLRGLSQFPDAAAVAGALKPLLHRVAEVSRLRRTVIVAGCLILPLFGCVSVVVGTHVLDRWNEANPGILEINFLMQQRTMRMFSALPKGPTDEQLAVYLAAHHRVTITNETKWSSMFAQALVKGAARKFVEQSLVDHPTPTADEVAAADQALKPFTNRPNFTALTGKPWFPFAIMIVALVFYVGTPALIAALLFRGGLVLLVTGVTFVRRDGAPASRLRVFWRGLVAWSLPALAGFMMILLRKPLGMSLGVFVTLLFVGALTIVSLALTKRGLPDRLAGTWPVPR